MGKLGVTLRRVRPIAFARDRGRGQFSAAASRCRGGARRGDTLPRPRHQPAGPAVPAGARGRRLAWGLRVPRSTSASTGDACDVWRAAAVTAPAGSGARRSGPPVDLFAVRLMNGGQVSTSVPTSRPRSGATSSTAHERRPRLPVVAPCCPPAPSVAAGPRRRSRAAGQPPPLSACRPVRVCAPSKRHHSVVSASGAR